jgi:hypothetical protein
MKYEHLFPTADELLRAYANFLHVHCRKRHIAAGVFGKNQQTFMKLLHEGGKLWIEAPAGAPDILPADPWFLCLLEKMRQATRTNQWQFFTMEELAALQGMKVDPRAVFYNTSFSFRLAP